MSRSRAILADAGPAGRRQLKTALTESGFDVLEARTFEEASALVRRDVTVAVCDANLTGDDCAQLVERWDARLPVAQVPLVVVSGQRALAVRLSALRAGASNFVVKPASASLLLRNVSSGTRVMPWAAPRRVLVVDDSVTYGHALAEALSNDGHDVVLAVSAQEAREYLSVDLPDLILLDVFLPDTDGIDLARTLRRADPTSQLPIMMLTGRENTLIKQRASEAGVSGFASKNTPLGEICAQVQNLAQGGLAPPPKASAGRAPTPATTTGGPVLFARVVAASGLSEVLGRSTLELALKRAGVDVAGLNPDGLRAAMPHIEQALNTFLPQSEIRKRVMAISAIAREG
ncbi:MAG: response regulator [Myxococcales bacterium]